MTVDEILANGLGTLSSITQPAECPKNTSEKTVEVPKEISEFSIENMESLKIVRHFRSQSSLPNINRQNKNAQLNSGDANQVSVVNSLDFTTDGSLLLASQDNEAIKVIDCINGRYSQEIMSKKYGVDIVRHTHTNEVIVHTSTKVNNAVRYLSLHENKYIRYFQGHKGRINCLETAPSNDLFITSSADKTVRLWTLGSPNCQGVINMPSESLVSFDPMGIIFGVAFNDTFIKLYDLKSFDQGPFSSFNIFPLYVPSKFHWVSMKFTPDGNKIAMTTDTNAIHMIDSFNGNLLYIFSNFENEYGNIEITFSPNSDFAICGSSNGKIVAFHLETGETLCTKNTQHVSVTNIKFNPVYAMLATAECFIDIWLPTFE
ncbi:MAG: WD repeat-containing protein 82 [Marteilia pararefringens]